MKPNAVLSVKEFVDFAGEQDPERVGNCWGLSETTDNREFELIVFARDRSGDKGAYVLRPCHAYC